MPRILRDRYEVLAVVGRGGEGEVLKALDRRHGRTVAIKVRATGPGADADAILSETRVLLGLAPHPMLPLVREDFFEDDCAYMVLDWVDGRSLQHVLDERGRMPVEEAAAVVADVAAALEHLHGHAPPVVHGDVKPANVIVSERGTVLVDLGLAALSRGGTRGYAAPERAAGRGGPSSDVFGLAATTFALLTGRPPGTDSNWDGVPAEWVKPIRKALSIASGSRYPSVREFVEALGIGLDAGAGVPSRRGFLLPAIAAAAVLTATIVLAASFGSPSPREVSGLTKSAGSDVRNTNTPASPTFASGGSLVPSASPSGSLSQSRPAPTATGARTAPKITAPRTGTYRFRLTSDESVPRAGSRDADVEFRWIAAGSRWVYSMSFTAPADQVDRHNERNILIFDDAGVSIAYDELFVKGCSPDTLGSNCIEAAAFYDKPMRLLRYPASVGASWSGTSVGRDAESGGDIVRSEQYSGRVVDRRNLSLPQGTIAEGYLVDWSSQFSGRHNGTHRRRMWIVPSLGIWSSGEEWWTWELEGSTYRSHATWWLTGFPA